LDSLGFFYSVHFGFDSIKDETVQDFTLLGGEIFDNLTLTFLTMMLILS
jgi:hypothetical protein